MGGRVVRVVDLVLGRPLPTHEEDGQRVGPLRGVAILGLDALASAAYGPEALLTVLMPLGPHALHHVVPITLVIVGLVAIVGISYRQTLHAYPNGGGSYTVAKENLGTKPSLLAAAALSVDYILNVSVAISAGVGALVSAVPALLPHTLGLCLGILAFLTLVNLRGVRESGAVFMTPTYLFVGLLGAVLVLGGVHLVVHGGPAPVVAPPPFQPVTEQASAWLLIRAFANGCTALTGVEAVSNGIPIFRQPSERGASRALELILGILMALLMGIALVTRAYHLGATPPNTAGYQSVLSQLTAAIVGRGPVYFVTMGSIIAVLLLSANTSFADFPRLCRLLAFDGFLPDNFAHRGRRLAFSHGVIALAAMSCVLLIVFRGVTDALIPLFAMGAFLAFTLSQAGMVVHWRRRPGHGAALAVNAVGATSTGVVCAVIIASKLVEGAWISVLLVLAIFALLFSVKRRRDLVDRLIRTDAPLEIGPTRPPIAVVLLRRWNAASRKALRFAFDIARDVVAVQVLTDAGEAEDLRPRWSALAEEPARHRGLRPPELVVGRSDFRRLYDPLLEQVIAIEREHPDREIAVIVPQLVEPRWYHALLHRPTPAVLRSLLLHRGGARVIVVEAPWYLCDWKPDGRPCT
jgi:amino acid transporter